MKTLLRWLMRLLFGFRTENADALRTPGPVLLVPNHQSLLDWLFLGVCLEDDWKFVVSSVAADASWLHRKILLNRRTFPIDTLSPFSAKRIAEYLHAGGRLVLFAEGRLSRTGTLMKLFEGTGFLLHRTRARVLTCRLQGVDQLPLTRHRNRKRWFPRISAHFSPPRDPPRLDHLPASRARALLTTWLRDLMVAQQFEVETRLGPHNVLAAIRESARHRLGQILLEDITRQELTGRRLLLGVDLLASRLRPLLAGNARDRVGILLPNVNANPVLILALWSLNRVPALLNFSTGVPVMAACVRLAGLRQILTSRAFLERTGMDLEPLIQSGIEILLLEDLRAGIRTGSRIAAAVRHRLAPGSGIPDRHLAPEDPALVLFTSGSEGTPKGVELTHANILANIRQALAVTDIEDHDRVFNALPIFHSFGITIGTLLPLVRGLYTFLYLSPLHYRIVPTAAYDRNCTVLIGTNTFLHGYARKAHPYDFRAVRHLFAGAEKVQQTTADLWARKFGLRILEGYGATECGPCISLNTAMDSRPGTAGRPLPGVECRLQPVEGVPDAGRLLVRGPNIMRGYLNPDANAAFRSLDGWYDTGDIVSIDADGYITIRGRLKRFAKVSGEMISLTAVEEALAGAFPHYGPRCEIAVISRPDEDKGEVLVAVANEPRLRIEEIREAIRARGLTNLCVPREVRTISEIPKLGTGKIDHRELVRLLPDPATLPSSAALRPAPSPAST